MTIEQLEIKGATPRVYSWSDLTLAIQDRIAALRAQRQQLQSDRTHSAQQRAELTRGATPTGNFGRV